MRDLIITQNITLDGVVDNALSWFGPADQEGDFDDVNEVLMTQARTSDAFLVGRTTFEEMRGYWPQQHDDATGVTDHLNRVAKYVVSTTLEDPEWDGTTVLRGPLQDDVRVLKAAEGRDIVATGSIALCHALIDAGSRRRVPAVHVSPRRGPRPTTVRRPHNGVGPPVGRGPPVSKRGCALPLPQRHRLIPAGTRAESLSGAA